jgi:hypothetical protein
MAKTGDDRLGKAKRESVETIPNRSGAPGRQRLPGARRAFTVAELAAALAIFAVLSVAIGSTLVIASRAVDDGTAPGSKTAAAREIGDIIIGDIGDALEFTKRGDHGIEFTVPDRDSNGLPETICYEWDGNAGGNLYREYNGGGEVLFASDVHAFDLSYLTRTVRPPPQACCYLDGACVDEVPDDCTANGGLPKGRNTECATTDCVGACCQAGGKCTGITEAACSAIAESLYQGDGSTCDSVECPGGMSVLFVVKNDNNPTSQEELRIDLMESWNFVVTLIDDNDNQSTFDTALADADVAYVSEEVDANQVGDKLSSTAVGVVNEEPGLFDDLGFSNHDDTDSGTQIEIVNNTHYITEAFGTGRLTIADSSQPFMMLIDSEAPGLTRLAGVAYSSDLELLATLSVGAGLSGGGTSPNRRVKLPWGGGSFDFGELNDDGRTILKRSLEWAAQTREACLLGHWTLDSDGSDNSSNAHHGVLAGNASIDTSVATNIVGSGKLAMDGNDDFLELSAHSATLGTLTEGTIAGWVNTSVTTGLQALFSVSDFDDYLSYSGIGLWQGKLYFDVAQTNYQLSVASNAQIADGTWHHVAVTVDGRGNSLYIDGVKLGPSEVTYYYGSTSGTSNFLSTIDDVDAVHIGVASGSGRYEYDFNGLIDDVQLYRCALSESAIAELAAASSGPVICGDATCGAGEDPCNCPGDCGGPTASEQPNVDCADGKDNDCDGHADCDDPDCTTDPACAVCGDGSCATGETRCNCPADCGSPSASETGDDNCADLADNDCDGQIDCMDMDCQSSAHCAGTCYCDGAYADDFESGDFTGDTGSLSWPGNWIEVGESDGWSGGDIKIAIDGGGTRLQLRDNDNGGEGVERNVPLCPGRSAQLSLIYRRNRLDRASDYVKVEISANGAGGPWVELTRFPGPDNDNSYQPYSTDISAFATQNTRIRLITSPDMGGKDAVYFDDVEVTCGP